MSLSRVMPDDSNRTQSAIIYIEVWPNDEISAINRARIAVNFCSLLTVDSRSFRMSSLETKFIKVTAVTYWCRLFLILNSICVQWTSQITRWDNTITVHRIRCRNTITIFVIIRSYPSNHFYLSVRTAFVEKFQKNTIVVSKRLFFFYTV